MRENINEEVSVVCYYRSKDKKFIPHLIEWRQKDYPLGQVDGYHNYYEGRHLQHIFELVDIHNSIWFRLRFDSSNLHWTLEAIHDGYAS